MKKIIAGVGYDTDKDVEVSDGECGNEDGTIIYTLRKTSTSAYYICGDIMQMWDHGWKASHTNADLVAAGIKKLPSPRVRSLTTIRPVSREEGLRWYIANFVPDEFKPDILRALEQR